jgi:hypothetical protein
VCALASLSAVSCSSEESGSPAPGSTGGKAGTGGNVADAGSGGEQTGGNGGGGAGGGGGWSLPTACAATATVPSTDPVIADFECLYGEFGQSFNWFPYPSYEDWPHGGYVYWNSEIDETWQAWDCNPTFKGGLGGPGYNSDNAGYVDAMVPALSWGLGLGIWMTGGEPEDSLVTGCIDASAFTGISFYAKGTNTATESGKFVLSVSTFAGTEGFPSEPRACVPKTDGSSGLDCTGKKAGGCDSQGGATCGTHNYTFSVTSEWQKITVAWADLVPPSGALPINPAQIVEMKFVQDGNAAQEGQVELYVDDIAFTGVTADPRGECVHSTELGVQPHDTTLQEGTYTTAAACDGVPDA